MVKLTAVSCPPVVEVKIKRPDTKYQLGFSVQNGVVSQTQEHLYNLLLTANFLKKMLTLKKSDDLVRKLRSAVENYFRSAVC